MILVTVFMYVLFLIFADIKIFYKVVIDIDFLNIQLDFNRFAERCDWNSLSQTIGKCKVLKIFKKDALIILWLQLW